MHSRYNKCNILKNKEGKQYLDMPLYNQIPEKNTDIWIIWKSTDSCRKLAQYYYNSQEYYWIILIANNIFIESDFKPGQRIRIPTSLTDILSNL